MKKRTMAGLAWMLCVGMVPTLSAGQETLVVTDVAHLAVSTHPAVEAARWRVEAAGSAAGEARAPWWPTVSAVAVFDRYQEPMVVAPLHGFDPLQPPVFERALAQGHATVDWTVFDGGLRQARLGMATRQVTEASAAMTAATEAVVFEAVSSYLTVLSARSILAAHDAQVESLTSERDRATHLHEEGRVPWVHVLRTEASLSRAAAERESAAAHLDLAVHRLARVAGMDPGRVSAARLVPVAPLPGPPPARAEALAAARSTHPALERAASRAAASSFGVAAARSMRLPRVSMGGRYSAYGSTNTSFQPEWQVGTRLSYAVFSGGARRRAEDRAGAEAAAARAELAAATREVEDAVDAMLAAYRSASTRVGALESAVTQSAEVARIEALALDAGAGVQTDYLRAEADLLSSRAALAEARQSAAEAWVRLGQAMGRLSAERLGDLLIEVEP
jgi:outer membrane protein